MQDKGACMKYQEGPQNYLICASRFNIRGSEYDAFSVSLGLTQQHSHHTTCQFIKGNIAPCCEQPLISQQSKQKVAFTDMSLELSEELW
jgi:hypothetical protein